jgi:hypothetical protein
MRGRQEDPEWSAEGGRLRAHEHADRFGAAESLKHFGVSGGVQSSRPEGRLVDGRRHDRVGIPCHGHGGRRLDRQSGNGSGRPFAPVPGPHGAESLTVAEPGGPENRHDGVRVGREEAGEGFSGDF